MAPALERRLAGSIAAGHTGELKVSFYRGGVRLVLADGRLETAEAWVPADGDHASAAFPGLTFLRLLFGHRSLAELQEAFLDCWADADQARPLLNALFPKQASDVWPVG